jgi:hypothetical protein
MLRLARSWGLDAWIAEEELREEVDGVGGGLS